MIYDLVERSPHRLLVRNPDEYSTFLKRDLNYSARPELAIYHDMKKKRLEAVGKGEQLYIAHPPSGLLPLHLLCSLHPLQASARKSTNGVNTRERTRMRSRRKNDINHTRRPRLKFINSEGERHWDYRKSHTHTNISHDACKCESKGSANNGQGQEDNDENGSRQ